MCLINATGTRKGHPYARPESDHFWFICFSESGHPSVINYRTWASAALCPDDRLRAAGCGVRWNLLVLSEMYVHSPIRSTRKRRHHDGPVGCRACPCPGILQTPLGSHPVTAPRARGVALFYGVTRGYVTHAADPASRRRPCLRLVVRLWLSITVQPQGTSRLHLPAVLSLKALQTGRLGASTAGRSPHPLSPFVAMGDKLSFSAHVGRTQDAWTATSQPRSRG